MYFCGYLIQNLSMLLSCSKCSSESVHYVLCTLPQDLKKELGNVHLLSFHGDIGVVNVIAEDSLLFKFVSKKFQNF